MFKRTSVFCLFKRFTNLGKYLNGIQEVSGSIPLISTKTKKLVSVRNKIDFEVYVKLVTIIYFLSS